MTKLTEHEAWECLADLVLAGIEPIQHYGIALNGICPAAYYMYVDGVVLWETYERVADAAHKVSGRSGYIGPEKEWGVNSRRGQFILKMYEQTKPWRKHVD